MALGHIGLVCNNSRAEVSGLELFYNIQFPASDRSRVLLRLLDLLPHSNMVALEYMTVLDTARSGYSGRCLLEKDFEQNKDKAYTPVGRFFRKDNTESAGNGLCMSIRRVNS